MKRHTRLTVPFSLAVLATLAGATAAYASPDPLVGTWHERDAGTSNIFYFVDPPIGGVYHVLYYDDFTGPAVCGDNGPMLWSGFAAKVGPSAISGTFGNYWCPDNGDGVYSELIALAPFPFTLTYDLITDTISGVGGCVGTRQPGVKTVDRAIQELAKGKYPPSGIGVYLGCEG